MMGCVYRRGDSSCWWMSYAVNGRRVQESTRSKTKTEAERALRARLTEIDEGRFSRDLANLRFEHLFDTIEEEYRVEGRKSISRVRLSFKHLREHIGHLRVVEISTRALREYRRVRIREGAAPATVNQEFAHLRRAMELVRQNTRRSGFQRYRSSR